jgi:hypothetical protein
MGVCRKVMISEKEPLIRVTKVTDDQLARRYLLGILADEEERDAVEERLLADAGFAAVLESVERDLYDEYASGALPAQERKQFQLYMDSHPDSSRRLRFATALSKRRQASPMLRWMLAAAAALLLMIGGTVWFLSQRQSETMVAVMLSPGTQRSAGDQVQTVRIPPGAAWVRIELREGEAAKSVVVRFVDTSSEVWRGPVEAGSAKVPADRLTAGDHVLTTTSATGEELADYVFRVAR